MEINYCLARVRTLSGNNFNTNKTSQYPNKYVRYLLFQVVLSTLLTHPIPYPTPSLPLPSPCQFVFTCSLGAYTCYHGGLVSFVSVREICVLLSELVSRQLIRNTSDWDHDLLLWRLFPVFTKTNKSKVHHALRCHLSKTTLSGALVPACWILQLVKAAKQTTSTNKIGIGNKKLFHKMSYVTICTSWKVKPKFFKFIIVICVNRLNP